jgi:hypothetical protein
MIAKLIYAVDCTLKNYMDLANDIFVIDHIYNSMQSDLSMEFDQKMFCMSYLLVRLEKN